MMPKNLTATATPPEPAEVPNVTASRERDAQHHAAKLERVTNEFRRYEGELLPGTAEQLGKTFVNMSRYDPPMLAGKVAELMGSDHLRRYRLDPDAERPTPTPRQLLERHADLFGPDADLDALAAEIAPHVHGIGEPRAVEFVVKLAERRKARQFGDGLRQQRRAAEAERVAKLPRGVPSARPEPPKRLSGF